MLGMKPFGALGAGGRGGGGLGRRAALYLDFVNGMYTVNRQRRALADIMTIAGGVNGTRVNSAGLIEAATCPRFDYDPVTLAPRGLLIEETRSNIVFPSGNLSSWTPANVTFSNASVTAPDGANTVTKIEENNVNGVHAIVQQLSGISAGSVHTISIYAKKAERSWIVLSDSASTTAKAFFNLNDGTVGTVSGTGSPSATISNAGDGYYRCTLTFTVGAGGTPRCRYDIALSNGVDSYQGVTGSGLYIFGAQMEAGAFATSYIPTTSAAVTRTADSLAMTGTDFSSWWNPTEGTIVVKFDCFGVKPDDNFIFTATDAGGAEQFRLNVYNGIVFFEVVAGGVGVVAMNLGAIDIGSHTLAVGYKANDFAACLDGGAVSVDTSGAVPAVDRAGFGRYAASSQGYLNGHIYSFGYTPVRLNI